MYLLFIYIKVVTRYRSDIILIVPNIYNHCVIVIKVLYSRYFDNTRFLTTRIAIVIVTILVTMPSYVFELGQLKPFDNYLFFSIKLYNSKALNQDQVYEARIVVSRYRINRYGVSAFTIFADSVTRSNIDIVIVTLLVKLRSRYILR